MFHLPGLVQHSGLNHKDVHVYADYYLFLSFLFVGLIQCIATNVLYKG